MVCTSVIIKHKGNIPFAGDGREGEVVQIIMAGLPIIYLPSAEVVLSRNTEPGTKKTNRELIILFW